MPWLSAMIWSQTAASSGPYTLSRSSARASLSPSPPIDNSGSPARTSSPMPVRAAQTIAIRSASEPAGDEPEDLRRRLVEPLRVVDDADQRLAPRRPRRGASAWRAPPGTGPGLRPRSARTRSRALRAAGRAAARADRAWGRRADGGRCRRAPSPTRRPPPSRRASRRHGPTGSPAARSFRSPASPRSTTTPLRTGERVGQQPVERIALGAAPEEHGRASGGLSGHSRPKFSNRRRARPGGRPRHRSNSTVLADPASSAASRAVALSIL